MPPSTVSASVTSGSASATSASASAWSVKSSSASSEAASSAAACSAATAWAARRRDRRPERSARRREASTRRDRLALTASMRLRRSSSWSAGRRLTMMVMCEVRLRILVARPRARGRQRFMVVPSSAKQADT